LVKKAKVRPISTYGLRHTAASAMAALGVPMLFVSRTLGHSRISTTADIYSSVFPESQREVAGRFDSFLKDL
jgi:integrase